MLNMYYTQIELIRFLFLITRSTYHTALSDRGGWYIAWLQARLLLCPTGLLFPFFIGSDMLICLPNSIATNIFNSILIVSHFFPSFFCSFLLLVSSVILYYPRVLPDSSVPKHPFPYIIVELKCTYNPSDPWGCHHLSIP
jgi:hypothetical protein